MEDNVTYLVEIPKILWDKAPWPDELGSGRVKAFASAQCLQAYGFDTATLDGDVIKVVDVGTDDKAAHRALMAAYPTPIKHAENILEGTISTYPISGVYTYTYVAYVCVEPCVALKPPIAVDAIGDFLAELMGMRDDLEKSGHDKDDALCARIDRCAYMEYVRSIGGSDADCRNDNRAVVLDGGFVMDHTGIKLDPTRAVRLTKSHARAAKVFKESEINSMANTYNYAVCHESEIAEKTSDYNKRVRAVFAEFDSGMEDLEGFKIVPMSRMDYTGDMYGLFINLERARVCRRFPAVRRATVDYLKAYDLSKVAGSELTSLAESLHIRGIHALDRELRKALKESGKGDIPYSVRRPRKTRR